MRAHVQFCVDGIDLKVAFDCTMQEAYALHQHIIERASKSKVDSASTNSKSMPCSHCESLEEVTRMPPLRLEPPKKAPEAGPSWWEKRQAYAHAVAKAKGWWDRDSDDSRLLMLMVCELAEACEWLRQGNPPSDHIPPFLGLEEELADVVIRIMDYAGARELNVAGAIETKLHFNAEREHKHGGKEF